MTVDAEVGRREERRRYPGSVHGGALAILVIVLAIYLPAVKNGFVNWDDGQYVVYNPFIRSLDGTLLRESFMGFHAANWHPLTWLSHAVDYAIWGPDPFGHHLTNIIFHAANSYLVVLLVVLLLGAGRESAAPAAGRPAGPAGRWALLAAAVAGLLFGVHPVHVESVAWVSERKDVLSAFFYILSLLAYLRYAGHDDAPGDAFTLRDAFRRRSYALALLFFALALMSKPMAVSLPLILIVLDWYPLARVGWPDKAMAVLIEKLPFFLLSIASAVLTILAQSSGWSINSRPLFMKTAVALHSIAAYLGSLFFPTTLLPFYPYPRSVSLLAPEYAVPALLVAGISVACLLAARRYRIWPAAWFSFLIMLAPVLGIVQVGDQARADRYLYLPSIAVFILAGLGVAYGVRYLVSPRRWRASTVFMGIALMAVVLGLLVTITHRQILVWRTSVSLWTEVINGAPGSAKPYHQRGNAYRALGRYGEALRDFSESLRLRNDNADCFNDRGIVYAKLKRFQEAISDFSMAILLRPDRALYYRNRGNAYGEAGRFEEARRDMDRASIIENAGGTR